MFANFIRFFNRWTDKRVSQLPSSLHYTQPNDLPQYMPPKTMEVAINDMVAKIHDLNQTWWTDLDTGAYKDRNTGEVLMLIVTELAEAMEGARKGLMDDHIKEEKMFDVELADAFIRLLDLAGGKGVNLGKMVTLKLEYNKHRADHKIEARRAEGGKKC